MKLWNVAEAHRGVLAGPRFAAHFPKLRDRHELDSCAHKVVELELLDPRVRGVNLERRVVDQPAEINSGQGA